MKKIFDWFDDKKLAVMMFVGFIISTVPFFYLAHYARPGGDDFGYAVLTRHAWVDTGSLWEVFIAALQTVRQFYYGWSGDWLGIFFYSLMPEVFAPYSFWIGPYFILLVNIIGTFYFFYYFLIKVLKISWEYFLIFYSLIMLISLQYIPSYNIGMYWLTGAIHYIVPQIVFLISLIFLHKFIVTEKKYLLFPLSLCGLIFGGMSYHHSLLLFMIYLPIIIILAFRKRVILWLLIPFISCMVSFLINVNAPGIKYRSSEFGFSLEIIIATIIQSFKQELLTPFEYINSVPLLIVIFLLIIVFGWFGMLKAVRSNSITINFRYPLLYIMIMFIINSALKAPRVYSVNLLGVDDASLGLQVIEWLFFFLTWFSAILYCQGWIISKLLKKQKSFLLDEKRWRNFIVMPVLLICLLLCYSFRSNVKESFSYQAYIYVKSGAAAEYKWRIAEYMEILLDDSIEEAFLKPINDEQGPLLHWTVTNDETNFVNMVYRDFYRKKIVIVRDEDWYW